MKNIALILLLWLCPSVFATEQWDVHEATLTAQNNYANPFRDVTVTATLTHQASATTVTVQAFHDGGGSGTQSGNLWRLRFQPDRPGSWTWTTTSSPVDPGLHGQSGSFTATAPGPNNHGPIQPAAPPYLHMPYADGTYKLQIGLWVIPWQHSAADRQQIYQLCQQNQITRFYSFVVDNSGLDKFLPGDFWRYNLGFMNRIDTAIEECQQNGITINLALYRNDTEKNTIMPQDEQFFRYAMARWGAYPNVQLTISNQTDWHYGGYCASSSQINNANSWADDLGQLLAGENPFGAVLTTHNPGECYRSGSYIYYMPALDDWLWSPWTGFIQKQIQLTALSATTNLNGREPQASRLNERGIEQMHTIVQDLRTTYAQAVCVEEYGFEYGNQKRPSWQPYTPTGTRKATWAVFMAGAFGTNSLVGCNDEHTSADVSQLISRNTIRYFGTIADTFNNLPFWEMVPDNSIVDPLNVTISNQSWRSTYALAKPGEAYLIYLLNGGSGIVQLATGTYDATLLDPRDGTRTSLGTVGGGSVAFNLPWNSTTDHNNTDSSDWVLIYEKVNADPAATVTDLGGGCGGAVLSSTAPVLGQNVTITISGAPGNTPSILIADFLPVSLEQNCLLFPDFGTAMIFPQGQTDHQGNWSGAFPMTPDPQWAGVHYLMQFAFPTGSGMVTSNGLDMGLGY